MKQHIKQYWKKISMRCSCKDPGSDPYGNACDFCLAERGCSEYVEEGKMTKGITWMDLHNLLNKAWPDLGGCDYTRDSLKDTVRKAAMIPDPPGYWRKEASNEQRSVVDKLINTFVDVIEPGGPCWDDHAKTQCRLCGGWNGLHHSCPACDTQHESYSFEECVEKLNKLMLNESKTKTVSN